MLIMEKDPHQRVYEWSWLPGTISVAVGHVAGLPALQGLAAGGLSLPASLSVFATLLHRQRTRCSLVNCLAKAPRAEGPAASELHSVNTGPSMPRAG